MKIPYIQLIPHNQYSGAVETIVKQLLVVSFYISPFAWWKLYDLVSPLIEAM